LSVINATILRKNLFEYLNNAIDLNDVITVTTKKGNAVIISEEEYNSIIETAYINSIPGLADEIIKGMNTPTSELKKIDWRNELQD